MLIQDENKSPCYEALESFLPFSQRQDEASEKVSVLQTLRKKVLSFPLSISPVQPGTSNNSPKETKCTMEAEIRAQEDSDGNAFKPTPSPDPSSLPPWQQTSNMDPDNKKQELGFGLTSPKLGGSVDPLSPESIKPKQFLSPSPFHIKDQDVESSSPSLLHSTPIHSKSRSKGVCQPECSHGSEGLRWSTMNNCTRIADKVTNRPIYVIVPNLIF